MNGSGSLRWEHGITSSWVGLRNSLHCVIWIMSLFWDCRTTANLTSNLSSCSLTVDLPNCEWIAAAHEIIFHFPNCSWDLMTRRKEMRRKYPQTKHIFLVINSTRNIILQVCATWWGWLAEAWKWSLPEEEEEEFLSGTVCGTQPAAAVSFFTLTGSLFSRQWSEIKGAAERLWGMMAALLKLHVVKNKGNCSCPSTPAFSPLCHSLGSRSISGLLYHTWVTTIRNPTGQIVYKTQPATRNLSGEWK